MRRRVLLLATTTGYQTRMFGEAAEALGVKLVFATDRCDQLEDPWWDGAIPVRFHQEAAAVDAIVAASRAAPFAGIVTVGDRPTVVARGCARLGLPGHPPHAAGAARDKRLMREHFRSVGLLVPWFRVVPTIGDAGTIAPALVAGRRQAHRAFGQPRGHSREPSRRSSSRRSNAFSGCWPPPDIRMMQDPAADEILIEQFIDGREYAVEGVLEHGRFRTLAIFDKPDPLDGPFFEETLYVRPPARTRRCGKPSTRQSPPPLTHWDCCTGPSMPNAASTLVACSCSKSRRGRLAGSARRRCASPAGTGPSIGLEELLLRHALGEASGDWHREPRRPV